MKNFMSMFSASLLSFTILAGMAGNSYANSNFVDEVEEFGFSDANKVSGDELAGLRGGLRIGSLDFDFVITSSTLVDGVLQHTATIRSSILERNSALGDDMPSIAKLTSDILPENEVLPDVIPEGSDLAENNSPADIVQDAAATAGVDVIINTSTFATTIQNSNDNAVIQQFNQLDVTVSNLSEMQKLNIAQQLDFQSINSIR